MKARKIFGVVIVVSILAVVASTIALTTLDKEIIEIQYGEGKGIHSAEYTIDLLKDPTNGETDQPLTIYKDPLNGETDQPVGQIFEDPLNGETDQPTGNGSHRL